MLHPCTKYQPRLNQSAEINAGLRGFEVDEASAGEANRWENANAPHPVSFLMPPFVLPTRLFGGDYDNESATMVDSGDEADADPRLSSWAAFGHWISSTRTDKIGGVVLGSEGSSNSGSSSGHCPAFQERRGLSGDYWAIDSAATLALPSPTVTRPPGVFGILMFSLEDLLRFGSVACKLVDDSHKVEVLLYDQRGRRGARSPALDAGGGMFVEGNLAGFGQCDLGYRSVVDSEISRDRILDLWLDGFVDPPDVLVASVADKRFDYTLSLILKERKWDKDTTLIQLPREDLPFTDWMVTLSLQEWKSKVHGPLTSTSRADLRFHHQTGTFHTSTSASSPPADQPPSHAFSTLSRTHDTSETHHACVSTWMIPQTKRLLI